MGSTKYFFIPKTGENKAVDVYICSGFVTPNPTATEHMACMMIVT